MIPKKALLILKEVKKTFPRDMQPATRAFNCEVAAGAVQATDGFDNRLTEDGCLPELVCVTAGDDDSDSVEQMERVATNNTAGDDDSDSGTSGKGLVEKRLNDLTMPQLRHLLDERGSTATGKWKEVLVDRCCDLGVTAAEIADAKKFKGKVRGLAVATPVRAPSTGFGSPATPPNTPPPAVAAPAVAPGTGDSSPVVTPGSAVSEGNSLTSVLMAPQSRVPGKCGFCSELVRIGLVNSLSCSDCPGASGEASGEHPQRNSNGFIATQVVIDVADSAQDSKRARKRAEHCGSATSSIGGGDAR